MNEEMSARIDSVGMALKRSFETMPESCPANKTYGTIGLDYRAYTDYDLNNEFSQFLLSVFDDRASVRKVVEDYHIGTSMNGNVIFWYIDSSDCIRTARLAAFNFKKGTELFETPYWLHTRMKRDGVLPENWRRKKTLFGEHLLQQSSSDIAVVSSEETAVIMAILYPQYLWMASGGDLELTITRMSALSERRVAIIPSFDINLKNAEDWGKRSQNFNHQGFRTQLVNWWPRDIIFKGTPKTVSEWIIEGRKPLLPKEENLFARKDEK